MTDLDELIAEADKSYEDVLNVAQRERDVIRRLADALESVRAERDAALARIAEIEVERDEWRTEHGIVKERSSTRFQAYQQKKRELRAKEIERDKAEARIAEAAKLHRPVEIEPSSTICGHCSFQLPNGRYFGKIIEWPCPTVAALVLNEGEHDES